MLVQQIAGGDVSWNQLPVYLGAELLAGALAALLYGVLSQTAADRELSTGGVDLGAPDPEPATTRQGSNV
jgi:glycerol uptake facilitator protein